MTHDELIAKMAEPAHNLDAHEARNIYLLALRAVVELHKPETGWVDGIEVENHHCSCDPYNEYDMGYPCETIQVIEEQLK